MSQVNRIRKIAAWVVVIAMILFAASGVLVYFFETMR
jgi:cytochrome b subunit of formate dehydrogenase